MPIVPDHPTGIAVIVPIDHEPPELWGTMRGFVTVSPDTDITAGTDEIWDAER